MPIYEYRCAECSHQDEHLQKVSEPPLTVCPSCGKPAYKKLLSAAGFQLKGSGWYVTDFRNKGSASSKTEPKADAKGDAKTDSKAADTKSESKTESKSESKSESKTESKSDSKPQSKPTVASD